MEIYMNFQRAESALTTGIEKLAAARKQIILESETNIIPTGRMFYVSNRGNNASDGTSPSASWQTLDRVSSADLKPGDTVFFKRGDIFRGFLQAKPGVTYSAYGKGHKPMLFTSPFNGAKFGKWLKTDVPDVYRFSEKIYDDVGCIIFDVGYAYATKATVDFSTMTNVTTGKKFESYRDLEEDLSFYHDLGGPNLRGTEENSTLYLKSTMGAPDERFYDIEFGIRKNCINIGSADHVRINNLCVKYCGCHGVGAGTVDGLTVDHCEFGWIGGSVQFYKDSGKPVRFGNAIEIYGGCSDYTVESCYIHDIYDAGITHQFSSGGDQEVIMKDISYHNNIIENCVYSIEYFMGKPDADATRKISHVRIYDNIMRFAGYGFGRQRPDKSPDAHIKSWDHMNTAENVEIFDNIFQRSRYMMLHIACDDADCMPIVRNNIFLQTEGGSFGRIGAIPTADLPYTDEAVSSQAYVDDSNIFYVL